MKSSIISKRLLVALVLALLILIVVAAILFFFPANAHRRDSTSLEDYGRFIREMSPLDCLSFPDESLLSEDNCVFFDKFRFDGSHTPQYLSYALCTFSEEVYQEEVSRLAALASEYSEEYFDQPAYVLYLNFVGRSEYALVDRDSRTIHYICYSSNRFIDRLPAEDRLKAEFAEHSVAFRDLDLYYDRYYR